MSDDHIDLDEIVPTIILGKDIGTSTGWDDVDTLALCFYNFIPNELGKKWIGKSYLVVYDTLSINFETGKCQLDATDESEPSYEIIPDWGVLNQ